MSTVEPNVLRNLNSEVLANVNQGKKRTFRIDVDYTYINEDFYGTFIFHHPSQMERLKIGVIKAQLLGGIQPLDVLTDNIAHMTATLEVVVDKRPNWFDVFSDELDYEVLEDVYIQYSNWMDSFRKVIRTASNTGDSQNGGSKVPVVGNEDVPGTTN